MTPNQLELTRLLGSKELGFGCVGTFMEIGQPCIALGRAFGKTTEREIDVSINGIPTVIPAHQFKRIGHPVTISDFHRWLVDKCLIFEQRVFSLVVEDIDMNLLLEVSYLSSKPLLDQSEETLKAILNLIKSNG